MMRRIQFLWVNGGSSWRCIKIGLSLWGFQYKETLGFGYNFQCVLNWEGETGTMKSTVVLSGPVGRSLTSIIPPRGTQPMFPPDPSIGQSSQQLLDQIASEHGWTQESGWSQCVNAGGGFRSSLSLRLLLLLLLFWMHTRIYIRRMWDSL